MKNIIHKATVKISLCADDMILYLKDPKKSTQKLLLDTINRYSKVPGYKNQLTKIIRLARLRRPKIVCSPSYADFRSRANTAMLLDLGHMLRGEHIWEVWG
jgi:hypothetical protein